MVVVRGVGGVREANADRSLEIDDVRNAVPGIGVHGESGAVWVWAEGSVLRHQAQQGRCTRSYKLGRKNG